MKENENHIRAISSAGLLHDIGKMAERAGNVFGGDADEIQQEYRYGHAFNTSVILEKLFGEVILQRLSESDSVETNLLNLASRHHAPRTFFEQIIQKADWIASGHERMRADEESIKYETEGRERKSQVSLVSILGRVSIAEGYEAKEDHYYRLLPIHIGSDDFKIFFPVKQVDYPPQQVRMDYPELWKSFTESLNHKACEGIHPIDHFETLLEICRMHQWCVPASTRKEELPDVSLFEHQKGTAAVAACLYAFHKQNDQMNESALGHDEDKKFLLFCGDIAGIQRFIYQISSKGAYRLLKGRSFLIQLLCELLARHMVQDLGLTTANILYASGGKFYLLLANTENTKKRLEEIAKETNRSLLNQFNGELYLRTGFDEVSPQDLYGKSGRTLAMIWDELTQNLVLRDRQRYADYTVENIQALFSVDEMPPVGDCPVCHASVREKNEKCINCKQLEDLGRLLGTARFLLIGHKDKIRFKNYKPIKLPLGYHLWILEELPEHFDGEALALWSLNTAGFLDAIGQPQIYKKASCALFLLGSNHRFDQDFEEIADTSQGIKRLGILRMDVDNLGKIFSHGLSHYRYKKEKEKENLHAGRFHSLARVTTLSGQLALFFSWLLPEIITAHKESTGRVGIVYSGGDDLFILGAWDALPDLALIIQQSFSSFCCCNPNFSLSGGLVITGGKFPIYKSAEMAGKAEELSKSNTSLMSVNGLETKVDKNSFTFLGIPMHWSEFSLLHDRKEILIPFLSDTENLSLLTHLRKISNSWEESRNLLKKRRDLDMPTIIRMIDGEKWRWQMVYSLARYSERKGISQKIVKDIQSFILNPLGSSNRTGIELLGVLVRWCELRLRKEAKLNKGGIK
ncbi:MAG: hypothetical protein A4E72_00418 [Syntrophus sp. PtaU1.Bin208]|nr:MAG: hypothetical protein A4E72_00418 [Syntrophus sp. PtaU1.Bin208]